MFNKSTRRRRHNPSSNINNSTTKQSTNTATQKLFATQSQNIMMGSSNASDDEPTISWIIVCAILYVLSGVTQVSLYYTLYACSLYVYKSAYLMSFFSRLTNSLL